MCLDQAGRAVMPSAVCSPTHWFEVGGGVGGGHGSAQQPGGNPQERRPKCATPTLGWDLGQEGSGWGLNTTTPLHLSSGGSFDSKALTARLSPGGAEEAEMRVTWTPPSRSSSLLSVVN